MINLLENFYYIALDASFWLVIGLFIGGLFKTLIPTEFLHKHLSQGGFGSVIKAAILGAPLPLCSCGVIPAAMGLRDAGASKSATTSFLVSTPETGVDSVFITYAMMGPFMAIVRPIIAVFSAITTGTLVNFFDYESDLPKVKPDENCCSSKKESSCCDPEVEVAKTSCCETQTKKTSCCSSEKHDEKSESLIEKIYAGIKYAFTELLDNIVGWLVIGIAFAAIIQTFVSNDILIEYGSGWSGMLIMLVVGIPMYVCATASTPLAAGFLLAGISPGAVIVFLLAGPATNMATLGIINKQMGKRTMVLYLCGIMSTALISGLVVDYLVTKWSINIQQHLQPEHSHIPEYIQLISLIILLLFSLRTFISKFTNKPPKDNCCSSN